MIRQTRLALRTILGLHCCTLLSEVVKFHVIEAFLGLVMENFFTFLKKKGKEKHTKFWTAIEKPKLFLKKFNSFFFAVVFKSFFLCSKDNPGFKVKVVLEQSWTLTRIQTVWLKSQVGASLLVCLISPMVRSWRYKMSISRYYYQMRLFIVKTKSWLAAYPASEK